MRAPALHERRGHVEEAVIAYLPGKILTTGSGMQFGKVQVTREHGPSAAQSLSLLQAAE